MARRAYLIGHNGPSDVHLDNLQFVQNDVTNLGAVLNQSPASFDQVQIAQPGLSPAETLHQFEILAAAAHTRIRSCCISQGMDIITVDSSTSFGKIPTSRI
jgi:hypothetical protein